MVANFIVLNVRAQVGTRISQIEEATAECSGTLTLTESSGVLNDKYDEYPNNLDCGWIIDPPEDDPIHLEITYLSTEHKSDYVRVYDGGDDTAALLGEFSGDSEPDSIITSTNGVMFVRFTTDESGRYNGFRAKYLVSSQFILCHSSCLKQVEIYRNDFIIKLASFLNNNYFSKI